MDCVVFGLGEVNAGHIIVLVFWLEVSLVVIAFLDFFPMPYSLAGLLLRGSRSNDAADEDDDSDDEFSST